MLLASFFYFILFKRLGTIILPMPCFSRSQSEPLAMVLALVLFWQNQASLHQVMCSGGLPQTYLAPLTSACALSVTP